ncbi:hypothetical protein BDW62DRAFT_177639 [Aspergillus aurantiobrunneus]
MNPAYLISSFLCFGLFASSFYTASLSFHSVSFLEVRSLLCSLSFHTSHVLTLRSTDSRHANQTVVLDGHSPYWPSAA